MRSPALYRLSILAFTLLLSIAGWATVLAQNVLAPPLLAAYVQQNGVVLQVSRVPGAAAYNIYRGTSPGGEGSVPILAGVGVTSFDSNASYGATYYYQAAGVSTCGEGPRSTEVSVRSSVRPLPAPDPFAVTGGRTSALLAWR